MLRRVIIDTDPGVDDTLALILALNSPELDVELITTVAGNVSVEQGTANLLRILGVLGRDDVPIARGSSRPMKYPLADSGGVHGEDGLGDIDPIKYPLAEGVEPSRLAAAEAILRTIRANPAAITIITLGPLTNLALALLIDSQAAAAVKEIIAMLGAISVPGNVTPAAEFNAYCDPHAVAIVLESGVDITLVGLDVTQQVRLSRQVFESRAKQKGPVSNFLADCTRHYFDVHQQAKLTGCYLHDPLAVAVALDPSLVATREVFVQVETSKGPARGMTIADLRPAAEGKANAKVCLEVDSDRFLELFLTRTLG